MDINSTTRQHIDPLYATHPHAKAEPLTSGPLNILSLPVDKGGCGYYRVRQILASIKKQGLAKVYILEGKESEEEVAKSLEVANVIIARNGTAPFVRRIKTMYPEKPLVFDHDDNTLEILPSNEHYRDHGVEDVTVETEDGPHEVWKTGVNGFNKYSNLYKRKELEFLLSASDLNTSPTEHLSSLWAKYNGKAAVIPNALDFELYPDLSITDPNKGDEIRLGWQGGVSHAGDFEEVSKAIKRLMGEYKNLVFYTVGSSYKYFFKGYESRIREIGWTEFVAHPYRMASLCLDIGIIPLQDAGFNDYKSEVKFTEFAGLRVPVVVQDRLPYNVVAKHEKNALLFNNSDEAYTQVKRLIENKKLAKKLTKNAYEWAKQERDLDKVARDVVKLYKSLL